MQTIRLQGGRRTTALSLYFSAADPHDTIRMKYSHRRGSTRMAQDKDLSRRDMLKTAGAVTAVAAVDQGAPPLPKGRGAQRQIEIGLNGPGSPGTDPLKHPTKHENSH